MEADRETEIELLPILTNDHTKIEKMLRAVLVRTVKSYQRTGTNAMTSPESSILHDLHKGY